LKDKTKKVDIYVKSIQKFSIETYQEKGCEYTATGQVDLCRTPTVMIQNSKIERAMNKEQLIKL
jgi:hypothetical protein